MILVNKGQVELEGNAVSILAELSCTISAINGALRQCGVSEEEIEGLISESVKLSDYCSPDEE